MCQVECLFGLLGYELNTAEDQYKIAGTPPPRERLAELAFEFYIAGIECEICHAISCKVENVTVADIYHCRSRCTGTISTCVQRLQEKQNRNIRRSHNNNKVRLTVTDYEEPLQPATNSEYLANSSNDMWCDTKSRLSVNDATKHRAVLNEVFEQPINTTAATVDRYIAQSLQTSDGQYKSLSKVRVEEGMEDDLYENLPQSRLTTVNERKETWACSSCTFVNKPTVSVCEMCFSIKKFFYLQQQTCRTYTSTAGTDNTVDRTSQSSCSSSSSASQTVKNYTALQPVDFKQGCSNRISSHQPTASSETSRHNIVVWNCSRCTYENKDCEDNCVVCGASRRESSEADSVQQ